MRNPLLAPSASTTSPRPAGCGPPVAAASRCRGPARARPVPDPGQIRLRVRAGLGYHQAGQRTRLRRRHGRRLRATNSKYVARRETPVYIAENCTQCMECITACPDTALPTWPRRWHRPEDRGQQLRHRHRGPPRLRAEIVGLEQRARARMSESVKAKTDVPFKEIIHTEVTALTRSPTRRRPSSPASSPSSTLAYSNVPPSSARSSPRRPAPAACSPSSSPTSARVRECVQVCGDHDALRMTRETEELNAELTTAQVFSRLLPDTPQKFLGLYNDSDAANSARPRCATTSWCAAITRPSSSGDGACAGCGEKSILRSAASVTRPTCAALSSEGRPAPRQDRPPQAGGADKITALKARSEPEYQLFRKTFAHVVMGLGGESDQDTAKRIAAHEKTHGPITDAHLLGGLVAVLERMPSITRSSSPSTAARERHVRDDDGASTGCKHRLRFHAAGQSAPYPWMNSFFQDGATISWLMAESIIVDHARRSVCPNAWSMRCWTARTRSQPRPIYFTLTHLDDAS